MSKEVHIIQASYEITVIAVPQMNAQQLEIKSGAWKVGDMNAPPGRRLHKIVPLKESNLVGQPLRLVCFFEAITEQVVQVPDNAPIPTPEAVMALNSGADPTDAN